jgi:hypothetical protein
MAQTKMNAEEAALAKRACNLFFDEGISIHRLQDQLGRGQGVISRWISEDRKTGRQRLKVTCPRSAMGSEPLTPMHKRIGMRIYQWRDGLLGLSPLEGSKKLQVSKNRFACMEAGTYNWSLVELILISERMGLDLLGLLEKATFVDPRVGATG